MQEAQSAYEANKAKELAYMKCKELEFLMIDADALAKPKATIIRKKQENIRVKDTNFDEMSYEHLLEIVKRNEIDMFVEHFGYDIIELAELERNEEQNNNSIESSDDDYYSSNECEEIKNMDFQTKADETVVIKNISTKDPFLNKLCSTRIMFIGVWVNDTTITTSDIDEAPAVETSETTELGEGKAVAIVEDVSAPAMDKGKVKESVTDETSTQKRKRGRPPSHVDGIRIYHKKRGRSERIEYIKLNKHESGSTPDKAFDVDD
nr:hypothetical protein [Tanacetum cinerariifolium]